ncbi:MAG: hypothetical protein B6244_11165 [Candidatus Cloacimonetes bacterium 4572_55]|nr:MAG: hypothetical protein B6244_11165 [Candidatus Cloacimonetes bacterium 4572_55]
MRILFISILILISTVALTFADPPDWQVDTNAYENSMTLTGQLFVNGTAEEDTANMVAAFVADEIRGVADFQYFPPGYRYVAYLTIWGNGDNEPITFKAYDASADQVLDIEETVAFEADDALGSAMYPYELHVQSEEEIPDLIAENCAINPTTVNPGDSVSASCTVRNQGQGSAGSSTLKYYLSSNTTYESGDTQLGTNAVDSLSAGGTSLENATLTIPADTAAGSWYILFYVDTDNDVDESDEDNNVANQQIIVTTTQETGSISGFVWDDVNADGVKQSGEPGLPDIEVFLSINSDYLTTSITAADGSFGFSDLEPGSYTVQVNDDSPFPDCYRFPTTDNNPLDIELTAGQSYTNANFGYQYGCGSIGNFVWEDLDQDGLQDSGEPGIAGVTVNLFLNGWGGPYGETPWSYLVDTTFTNSDGEYYFDELQPTFDGSYSLSIGIPPGYQLTLWDEGSNDEIDNDFYSGILYPFNHQHSTGTFLLEIGETDDSWDAGLYLQTCSPPSNVQASNGTYEDSVSISWEQPVNGANAYRVSRRPVGGGSITILTDHFTGASYQDNTAIPGTHYEYAVASWCYYDSEEVLSDYSDWDEGWSVAPEIDVSVNGASIPDNTGSYSFGSTTSGAPVSRTFTVENNGTANLTLTAPISVPNGFNVQSSFGSATVVAGSSTTFTIRLIATAYGNFSGSLSFANNDADENPYNFTISGSVGATSIVINDVAANDPSCYGGDDGEIEIFASGGAAPLQYSINNGTSYQSSSQFDDLSAGNYYIKVKDAQNNVENYAGNPVTLSNPSQLVINSVTATDPDCYGGDDGQIVISASGGSGSRQYSINNGGTYQTSPTFSDLGAGSYQIWVRDGNNCVTSYGSNPVTISNPSQLVINSVTATDPDCYGGDDGQIVISASGGSGSRQYSINNGGTYQTSPTFSDLGAGSYQIWVRDGNNCATAYGSNPVTISDPSQLVINSVTATDPDCYGGDDGQIVVSASGGSGSRQYSINNGQTYQSGSTFSDLSVGSYQVWVRDGNYCATSYGSNPVTISNPPQLVINSVTATDPDCYGGDGGQIVVSASGGTGSRQYSINNGQTYQPSPTFSDLDADSYQVWVRDENNCATSYGSNPVVLDDPPELVINSVTASDPDCYGGDDGRIVINASGGSGSRQYSINNGGTYQFSSTFSGLSAGSYTIRVRDENNCETPYGSNPVTISNPPQLVINSVNATDPDCYGGDDGQIVISASGGTGSRQYSINNGGTYQASSTFSDLDAGSYQVWVRDGNNCETPYGSNPVVLDDPPELVINNVNSDDPSCYGDENGQIVISASGGSGSRQYSINNGQTYQSGSTFSDLGAGSYQVWVRDGNNCETPYGSNPVVLDDPPELVINSVTASDPDCYGGEGGQIVISASGGTGSRQYSINNGQTYQPSPTFSDLDADSYQVWVRDENNCETPYGSNPVVLDDPPELVINSVTASDPDCYGGEEGQIEVDASGGTGVLLYSINGQTSQASPTFSELTAGEYEVVVSDENGCETAPETVTIIDPAQIEINEVLLTSPACHGDANGQIQVQADGGTGQLSYSIDNGQNYQNSPIFDDLTAADYSIIIQDQNGCEISYEENPVTLDEPEALLISDVLTSDPSAFDIDDGQIELTASGGTEPIEYSIDSGQSFQAETIFNNLPAGEYHVIVKDANDCELAYADNPVLLCTIGITATIDEPEMGSQAVVNAEIEAFCGVAELFLHYRTGGDESFVTIEMTAQNGNNFTADIPGSAITPAGLEWYISVQDTMGNPSEGDHSRDGVSMPTGIAEYDVIGGEIQSDYRLISVPYDLNDKSVPSALNQVGVWDSTSWRLWDCSDGQTAGSDYVEYIPGVNTGFSANFAPGQALWLISSTGVTDLNFGPGKSTPLEDYLHHLNVGWNLIGNPFYFDVDWSSIEDRNSLSSGDVTQPQYYNGSGFVSAATLNGGFSGYSVYSNAERDLVIPPESASALLPFFDVSHFDWLVELNLSVAGIKDFYNHIGILNQPDTNLKEKYRVRKTPFFTATKLSLTDGNASDIRLPSDYEVEEWPVHIQSANGGATTVSWDIMVDLPPGRELFLINDQTGQVTNMTHETSYSFHSVARQEPLRIILSDPDAIADLVIPTDSYLGQNYPNPFNPRTTIRFGLAQHARVNLSIYSVSGQLVSVVEDGEKPAGHHSIGWNGINVTGQQVSSGVYFYLLTIDGRTIQKRKMIMLK